MLVDDKKFNDTLKSALKTLVDEADREDRDIRERQIRVWRKLKLYWDGFQRLWYSEVAHDWRTDNSQGADLYSSYYDKPINVYRSYLESIIAALSVTVPSIKCYPDDADNVLDLDTARAGDKIAELIYKQNDAILLWIHALYTFVTEGLVAAYRYSKSDEKFGTYDEDIFENQEEEQEYNACPNCATELVDSNYCPECMDEMEPVPSTRTITNRVRVDVVKRPKTRQCIEVFGGLFVKVPCYAKKQEDCPYLMWAYETHYSLARARYPKANIHEGGAATGRDFYERWGRTSNQYMGDEPDNMVTVRNTWIRPQFYHILREDQLKEVQKVFPKGVKVIMVDDKLCEAEEEFLDDHWTLTHNPLSDYLHHEPSGLLLVNIQEITNDLVALVLQTIEAGISQTFADPKVLNFAAYEKVESTPGLIFPARARAGQALSQAFHETKTATLSREIEPFMQRIQELGQLTSGALPSLFGGQAAGTSRTAAEYSMSRAQALQRLQTTWKMLTIWWQQLFAKVIPAYVDGIMEDEKLVEQDERGNFINIFIRKAELQGKIGRIELEASEHLPVTFAQKKDVVMEILRTLPPDSPLSVALMAPENIGLLTDAVGIHDFTIPNQDDIDKQNEEIQQLLQSSPIPNPDPMIPLLPSIQIEPDVDNHEVQAEACRRWLISAAGRAARNENQEGYQNVLLHLKAHLLMIQPPPMPANQSPQASGPEEINLEGENDLNEQYGPDEPGIAVQ
jgi:hypothetical protein